MEEPPTQATTEVQDGFKGDKINTVNNMSKKNESTNYTPDMHFESMLKEAVKTSRDNTVEIAKVGVKVEGFGEDIKDIKTSINQLNGKIDGWQTNMKKTFVGRNEFNPVRSIVYGTAGAFGLAMISAVIGLILIK